MIKMGCNRWSVKIIASFLRDRKFQVHVGNHNSARHTIKFGVPQGSVLSPHLYNLYTSDIPVLANVDTSLYADDTAISTSSRFIKGLVQKLRKASSRLIKFFTKWKISINAEKTAATFHSRRKTKQVPPREVLIGGINVPVTTNARYLGIHLDNGLTLKNHLDKSVQKANLSGRRIYPYLRRYSFASKKLKLKMYKTYIRPILAYGAPVIAEAAESNKRVLQVTQNKYLRLIMNRNRYTRISELHESLKLERMNEHLSRINNKFYSKCETSENPLINNIVN